MKIEKITQYKVYDRLFPTLEKAVGQVNDLIGAYVDRMTNDGLFGPKHKLMIHQYLLEHKQELVTLLSVEMPNEEDE